MSIELVLAVHVQLFARITKLLMIITHIVRQRGLSIGLEMAVAGHSGRWPRTNFYCSYAFLGTKDDYYEATYPIFNNSTQILSDDPHINYRPTIVPLDWRIGAVNCKDARLNPTDYVCQNNTVCIDFDDTVRGYLCNCSKGYQGNPYLSPGCKDIDECADSAPNACVSNSICINVVGSYHCSCPKGYVGDGTPCIKVSPSNTKTIILAGMGSGLGFLVLALMSFWLIRALKKRREKVIKDRFFKRNGGLLLQQQQQQQNEGTIRKTKLYTAKELEIATDHFNENRILGHGGQGIVYKGMLSDGKIVAVKKSKLLEEMQLKPFINEVVILSQINHKNVVSLLGCCLETEVPLLVYEFMPNGSLYNLIHDPNNEFPFPWNMRLKIAEALAYLHSASSVAIYHRDIKSSNLLLDEKYVVKVSDFGTSKPISAGQTHLTTLVKGTFGYLDPEYFHSSKFTEKSDVYSFGVVLTELLTGKMPISLDEEEEERSLATWFRSCMVGNCLDTILDPQILEQGMKEEEVVLVAKLAQKCLNLKGKMRPTMKQVAVELESYRLSQRSIRVEDESEDVRFFEDIPGSISENDFTLPCR
ncbi:putative wall-associated receptor kinase-like 11 [Salvia splendens]|uniref:putative wall-associated receptor kinase-like 11 n=1 Tax=Salvia splendens TaxID=180675 RepID=UPI001C279D9E|nr:putative wall-associated receptor kinase-like 11 [Salvia splendens]